MKFIETPLKGAYIAHLTPFVDHRGKFTRLFCEKELVEIKFKKRIVQINDSFTSKKGTVRGMHYQLPPFSETKIVKCIKGAIFDVFIDIRRESPTFLQYHSEILSEDNMKMLIIPEGFAHGFQTLEKNTEVIYFVTGFYNKDSERGIRYNDPLLNIPWSIEINDVSEKDKNYELLDRNFKGIERDSL